MCYVADNCLAQNIDRFGNWRRVITDWPLAKYMLSAFVASFIISERVVNRVSIITLLTVRSWQTASLLLSILPKHRYLVIIGNAFLNELDTPAFVVRILHSYIARSVPISLLPSTTLSGLAFSMIFNRLIEQ